MASARPLGTRMGMLLDHHHDLMFIAKRLLRSLDRFALTAVVLMALSACMAPDTWKPTRIGDEACSIEEPSKVAAVSGHDPTSAPEPGNVLACWELQ